MHSSSKTTWPDRTSAAERGSAISGSGRTGPKRPATATGGHIPDISCHRNAPAGVPFAHLSRKHASTGWGEAPLDLDREAYAAQLAELRGWVDTVLRPNYGGYELRDCWPGHIHVIWELSTLAAEWHRTYSGQGPNLPRALEFYDRWLPGTMRRVNEFTRACVAQCGLSRRMPYDWTTR